MIPVRATRRTLFALAAGLAFLSATGYSAAQVAQINAPGIDAQRRQDEQRQQTEERASERPSVQTEAPVLPVIDLASLPQETPCFAVRELHLLHNPFGWLDALLQPVIGACIGKQAVRIIGEAASNALIARGFITSRVLIPEQNLASGVLNMEVIAGRVSAVRVATAEDYERSSAAPSTKGAAEQPDAAASKVGREIGWSRMVLPTYPGAIYNQRDVDQALESIRRLSAQAVTAFDIQPGDTLGESVLLIKPAADPPMSKRWHATIGADNYGIDSTGRFNLNGTFTFDSPLHLYDQLTLSGSTNADFTDHQKASRSGSVNWNVPMGYASFFVNASTSRYLQTVAGYMEPQQYRGDSAEVNAGMGYVPYRSASARTSAQVKLYHRFNHAYLDAQPIDYQARDLIGLETTLAHQQYFGPAVVSGGIAWRQTLLGMTKLPGTVIGEPDWNGKTKILSGKPWSTPSVSWWWKEGGTYRAEMQAAGAALVGGLGGGIASAAGSAAGAGLASISAGKLNALSDSIANSSPTANADIDRTLGNIVANVIATGTGAAVGGGDAGAFAGYNVDRFNRQLHPEKKVIKDLSNGDKDKEHCLEAAGCALVHCAAESKP